MTITCWNARVFHLFNVKASQQKKGEVAVMGASIGQGAPENADNNLLDKVYKSNNCLFIKGIKPSEEEQIVSLLAREDLGSYDKICFLECELSRSFFEIIVTYDQKYGQNLVVSLISCVLSKEVHEDIKNSELPEFKNFIIEINGGFIVLPGKKIVTIHKNFLNKFGFLRGSKMICVNIQFSDDLALSSLTDLLASCQTKNLILRKCTISDKFAKIVDMLEKSDDFVFLQLLDMPESPYKMFTNKRFITQNVKKLIVGQEDIAIPQFLEDKFEIKGNKSISFQELLLFKTDQEEIFTKFIQKFLISGRLIEFLNCKIEKNFIFFIQKFDIQEGKAIKFSQCSSKFGQSILDELQGQFRKKKNVFFQWDSLVYLNGDLFNAPTLHVGANNHKFVIPFLLDSGAIFSFETLKLEQLSLNKDVSNSICQILQTGVLSSVHTIKFVECEFTSHFLQCIDLIKEQENIFKFFFTNIFKTESAKQALFAIKNIRNSSIFISDLDSEEKHTQQSKSSEEKPFNPSMIKVLNMLKKDPKNKYKLDIIKKMTAANPGLPGQTLAEMQGLGFAGMNIQQIEKNIMIILDSWIVGYQEQKAALSVILLGFMRQRGMGAMKYPLLYGPPGGGKTSLCFAVAAVLKYMDTGVLATSLYDPMLGKSSVDDWISITSASDIHSGEYLVGFPHTYQNSQAGSIIRSQESDNPRVFCKASGIDEVDKFNKNNGKDIINALISILEQEQRQKFNDMHLDVPINLGPILFIMTANNLDSIPEHIRNRVHLIYIPPLLSDEFRKVSLIKWDDSLKRHKISRDKFEWAPEVFFWFADFLGASRLRDMMDCYEKIAQKIESSREKVFVTKKFLMDVCPNFFEIIKMAEKLPGYALGVLESQSGSYKTMLISASCIGRDRGEHIVFVPSVEQNKDNSIHGVRSSYQVVMHSILSNLLQVAPGLEGYKTKFANSFAIEGSNFNLNELNFFAGPAILAIVSAVIGSPIDHVALIGHTDMLGHISCPENANTVMHRVSALFTSSNAQIRKVFLPKNLPMELQQRCMSFLKSWCNSLNIPITSIKIVFVDHIKDVVNNLLNEQAEIPKPQQ